MEARVEGEAAGAQFCPGENDGRPSDQMASGCRATFGLGGKANSQPRPRLPPGTRDAQCAGRTRGPNACWAAHGLGRAALRHGQLLHQARWLFILSLSLYLSPLA
jgi:hypothetical protein